MDKIPKNTVIMCKGLPASGKSTWAKASSQQAKVQRINKDDLRKMLNNGKYSKAKEKFVLKVRDNFIKEAMSQGNSVIVDDTNLVSYHETVIRKLVEEFNETSKVKYTFEVKFFDVDVVECIRRDNLRASDGRVGIKIVMQMYNDLMRKEDDPLLTYKDIPEEYRFNRDVGNMAKQDIDLPRVIMCDLDGTLAILKYRHPFDPKSCESDIVNFSVKQTLLSMKKQGYKIILVSGRKDSAKYETERWLSDNWIPYDELHMRKDKDNRKDSIIKEEIYEQYILGKYYVEFILDDRDQVVDMWRQKLGLTVFQVNYGKF